ncbi:Asp23/Gls24 family envelope stress response protein [Mycolicibacterium sp.]|uniref:Asp23/Gls24 family envelope stress response protein n=1 Tax=Mycolicibacterium sp. TaxID=2320850 RepID=UPI001A34ABA0|nr:Asp23/Gls24 family envelope stress response protein [Mycolicibacterium sp.]MBJ7338818.1 Asp23/Gls24 family envelope stress response protein [Mycolicibacterium sp.]
MSEPDRADLIAAAVTAVPGVAGLHAGMFGEVATYLPGHRVSGIRTNADGVTEVHVTLLYGAPVRDTAALIRDAAARVAGGTVDVTVEDIVAASDTAAS